VNENLYRRFEPAEINQPVFRASAAMLTVTTAKAAEGFRIETTQIDPARLDRISDYLLQHGFTLQAERLAHAAQALREGRS
jgi:hypothetical protein